MGPPIRVDKLQSVQLRAIKMVRGWEHMPCEERMRELRSVQRLEGEHKNFLPVPEVIKKMEQNSLLRCMGAG